MASETDYASLVKQAEAAVAAIKDSELKGIAFSKILDKLLLGNLIKEERPEPKEKTTGKRAKSKTKTATATIKKRSGPKGYVEELIEDSFFKNPKTLAEVRAELGNRGHHIAVTSLSSPMMVLCQEKTLRRQKSKDGNKEVFTYSNW